MAAKAQVPIIEDDFHNELRYDGTPVISLRVSIVGDWSSPSGHSPRFSFLGLRVGWIVAPPEVMERLIIAKRVSDFHTSALIQAAVYHFCRRRLLDQHMERMRREYRRRRDTLIQALSRHCPPNVMWTHPPGGLFVALNAALGNRYAKSPS